MQRRCQQISFIPFKLACTTAFRPNGRYHER